MSEIKEMILREVLRWSGVTAGPHRFGGTEFRVDGREIGHLHGDYQADIPFSARLRRELVAAGKASPHHLYPNSGWVSYYIYDVEDVAGLLALLRMNYERLAKGRLTTDSSDLVA